MVFTRMEDCCAEIRVIAALVNPLGGELGKETVTLLNTTTSQIHLDGWVIADRLKRKYLLSGLIETNSPSGVQRSGEDIQLGKDAGTIALLIKLYKFMYLL